MKELSLNVLDIAQNSVSAGAKNIKILVDYEFSINTLKISISDDGKGMSEELLRRVTDPFTTTRTTRKVGLGIPLFKQSAEMTGGSFSIKSRLGEGTVTEASYLIDSIDRMPLGDIADTVCLLINADSKIRYIFTYTVDGKSFIFDTDEAKVNLGNVPITSPEVLSFLKEYINQEISSLNGGKEVI